mmetsp:Transcript_24805/g.28888  ORF Transcript_24805/g.28888 Transcript_24805/m.28888 type:complete len:162 (-) Transcript_24805:25-510(-)
MEFKGDGAKASRCGHSSNGLSKAGVGMFDKPFGVAACCKEADRNATAASTASLRRIALEEDARSFPGDICDTSISSFASSPAGAAGTVVATGVTTADRSGDGWFERGTSAVVRDEGASLTPLSVDPSFARGGLVVAGLLSDCTMGTGCPFQFGGSGVVIFL